MSGQLPGVTATSVHLIVLASSIPVPPPAAPWIRSGQPFASSVCPQGTAGHSWQVVQPGFKAALFRLNWTIQPTTDGILCFCYSSTLTPPYYSLSFCDVKTGSSWQHCIYQNSHRNSLEKCSRLKKKMHPTKIDQHFLTFWNTKDGLFWCRFGGGPPATRPRWECGHYKVTVEQGWLHLTWQSHTQICKSDLSAHELATDTGSRRG